MASGSSALWNYAPVEIAFKATIISLIAISALIFFIWARRTYRARYFARRDARAYFIRQRWPQIVSLRINPETWREKALERELVQTILLDNINIATEDELPSLLRCLRVSGLLDVRIQQVRATRGWKRQAALLALGRTRAPEAIPALAEALSSNRPGVVAIAVRALGNIGVPEAAIPILDRLVQDKLPVSAVSLKGSLVRCCKAKPSLLLQYMAGVSAELREVLARTLAEIATPDMGEDLAILTSDPSPEVRASAARALRHTQPDFAVPLLTSLSIDEIWFVRLRAVVSLSSFHGHDSIDALIRALCDTNRVVRQRAATALASFHSDVCWILKGVIATGDQYALHAFISELQRHGQYGELINQLRTLARTRPQDTYLIAAAENARNELAREIEPVTFETQHMVGD